MPAFFYVQDERYFAKEHMDVRREAFQVNKPCRVAACVRLTSHAAQRRASGRTECRAAACGQVKSHAAQRLDCA